MTTAVRAGGSGLRAQWGGWAGGVCGSLAAHPGLGSTAVDGRPPLGQAWGEQVLRGPGHGEAATSPGVGLQMSLCVAGLNPESLLCLPVGQVHCLLAGWKAV